MISPDLGSTGFFLSGLLEESLKLESSSGLDRGVVVAFLAFVLCKCLFHKRRMLLSAKC